MKDIRLEFKKHCSEYGIPFEELPSIKSYDEDTLFCPAGMQKYKNNFLYGIPYKFKNLIFKFIGKDTEENIDLRNAFSKEFCGGPHVNNTKELGKFKIIKEKAVSAGVRRIKAILE